MKKRAADILIETLVDLGVNDCFAVVGGGSMHLDNALALNDDMHKYFMHHEQSCSMAADSYARISGYPALVCVTSGPGATNAITGVMGAWVDSIPMIVLSGQVRYDISVHSSGLPLRYRGPQEFDIISSVSNMTKYAKTLTDPMSVKAEIEKAYTLAMEGRRGPVWLDIPLNVQNAIVETEDLIRYQPSKDMLKPSDQDLDFVREEFARAKRPCVLIGSGVIAGGATKEIDAFMNNINVPVVGGAHVADVYYNEHPLFFGLSGNIGPRVGNYILQNADLILTVGSSLGFKQTGYTQEKFAPNAKIIMVDVDENESKKPGLHVDHVVKSSVKQFLSAMSESDEKLEAPSAWLDYCGMVYDSLDAFEGAAGTDDDERVCAYRFWKEFDDVQPADSIVCMGNNTACAAKLQVGKRKRDQRYITNYGAGSMGFDLPAAIGACVALKQEVICVTGDGSIMMNLQELQTIRHYDLPIKIIVFSNDGYNAFRQTCLNFFDGLFIGCNAETGVSFPSFKAIADLFGFKYLHCETNKDLKQLLTEFFDCHDRVLLEVDQRLDDPLVPKLMSKILDDGTFSTPSLEVMYPFMPEEKQREFMPDWN